MLRFSMRRLGPTAWLQWAGLARGGAPFLQSVFLSKIWGPGSVLAEFEALSMAVNAAAFVGLWTVTVYFVPAYQGADNPVERKVVVTLSSLALIFNGLVAAAAVGIYGVTTNACPTAVIFFAVYGFAFVSAALVEFYLWANERYLQTGIYSSLAYGLTAFAPAVAALFLPGIEAAAAAMAIIAVLRLFYGVGVMSADWHGIRGGGWRKHVRLMSAPAVSSLLGGSVGYIDGFLARHRLGENEFLFFRYGGRELPLALLLANALATAGAGFVAAARRNGDIQTGLNRIKTDSRRLMHLVFPLTAFLLAISGPLFEWVYHPDLRPASRIFDIFLLLAVPRMLFPQSVLLGLGLNRFTLYGSLWEWPVHVGLSLTLIGPLGMYGPAWATLTAYVFGKGVLVVYALRAGVRLSHYHELRLWTVYTLLTLATFGIKWAYTA